MFNATEIYNQCSLITDYPTPHPPPLIIKVIKSVKRLAAECQRRKNPRPLGKYVTDFKTPKEIFVACGGW